MNKYLRVYSIYVPNCEKTAIRFRSLQPEPAYGIHMMDASDAPPVRVQLKVSDLSHIC
jgi:hypothetical protein